MWPEWIKTIYLVWGGVGLLVGFVIGFFFAALFRSSGNADDRALKYNESLKIVKERWPADEMKRPSVKITEEEIGADYEHRY